MLSHTPDVPTTTTEGHHVADPPSYPDTEEQAGPGPLTGPPRWVKVFGIVALVVALLVGAMLLAGHGPGRHSPAGDVGGRAPVTVLEPGGVGGHLSSARADAP